MHWTLRTYPLFSLLWSIVITAAVLTRPFSSSTYFTLHLQGMWQMGWIVRSFLNAKRQGQLSKIFIVMVEEHIIQKYVIQYRLTNWIEAKWYKRSFIMWTSSVRSCLHLSFLASFLPFLLLSSYCPVAVQLLRQRLYFIQYLKEAWKAGHCSLKNIKDIFLQNGSVRPNEAAWLQCLMSINWTRCAYIWLLGVMAL